MLSQIDKDLVTQCDAISARGGPLKLNVKDLENTHDESVSQLTNAPRVSARLRGVQPEIDLSQTPEVHARRSRRSVDGDLGCMPTPSEFPVYFSIKTFKAFCFILGQCSFSNFTFQISMETTSKYLSFSLFPQTPLIFFNFPKSPCSNLERRKTGMD